MRFAVLIALAGTALAGSSAAADSKAPAFLSSYCTACHGPVTQMANRRFDQLRLPPADADTVAVLQQILDKLKAGAMPPRAAKQPPAADKQRFIAYLTDMIAESQAVRAGSQVQTVLRRLNRREYINTVGDLLGINMLMFDPTTHFPRDQMVEHMDNIGDTLRTSGYLLEQYIDAAAQVIDKALDERPRPKAQTWIFNGHFRQQPELDYAHAEVFQQKFICLYTTMNTVKEEGSYGPLYDFAQGVPVDGFYEVKVQAEAVNRKNPYDPNLFAMDPEAPFRLGLVPGNAKAGPLHQSQPIQPRLGEVELGDNGAEWHTFRVWLDTGYSPRFTFPNGMNDGRRSFNLILNRYRNLLPEEQRNFAGGIRPARPVALRYGKLPQVRIHEVRVTGPLDDPQAFSGFHGLLGDKPFEPSRTREILEHFATRAYRRPARPAEVDSLVAVAERRRKDGSTPFEALKDAMKAALCSPAFLYLASFPDGDTSNHGSAMTSYALASRLSYFLWSTMPDSELMDLARSGDLQKPAVLVAQMRRMLADHRSQAFIEGFLDSWLNLRSLGDMPPDRDAFPLYYSHDLQEAMRTETQMFTRYILDHNESVANFLDSSYTFLNKPLAKLYGVDAGIASVGGYQFRKVKVSDPNRGGLLGQGSILTVSANGIETSPVTRGVWMLENIFGTPPSPPPDNVPALDPDVRGAKSIREILTKHRANASCMTCHSKIDPPGFALENFDPIGAWRTKYKNGVTIDASSQLEGVGYFENIVGLKKLLLERKGDFARALTERILTYGCGRRMESSDRPRIDAIVKQLADRGYGFRDLVELAVQSDVFRSN